MRASQNIPQATFSFDKIEDQGSYYQRRPRVLVARSPNPAKKMARVLAMSSSWIRWTFQKSKMILCALGRSTSLWFPYYPDAPWM